MSKLRYIEGSPIYENCTAFTFIKTAAFFLCFGYVLPAGSVTQENLSAIEKKKMKLEAKNEATNASLFGMSYA